jgi:hypothetical protein
MTATTLDSCPLTPARPTLAVAAGRNLIAAGAVFGLANLTHWGILSGFLHIHPAALSLVWPTAVVCFIVILNRLRCAGGEPAKRAGAWSRLAIWTQIGAALALAAASGLTGNWALMMWMSPLGLAFYGVAWAAATFRGGRAWMGGVALGAFCAAGGVALLVGTPAQYLAYAGGLFAFALLPGLALAFRAAR